MKTSESIKNIRDVQEIMKKRMVEEDVRDMHHKTDVADTFLGITKGLISPVKKNKLGFTISPDMLKQNLESQESD